MLFVRIKRRKHGDRRIKKRFLLFPKTIQNETRWMETASWEQYYKTYKNGYNLNMGVWVDYKWRSK